MSSCGYMFKPNERKEVKFPTIGTPQAFELDDPDCDLGSTKPKFSNQVTIWMIDKNGELNKQVFDLSNVSRAGLESTAISEALYSEQDIDQRQFTLNSKPQFASQFKDKRALNAIKEEHKNGVFKRINFCREDGGYRADSIENAALAAFVAINETNRVHNILQLKPGTKKSLNKIKLIVHPKLFAMESLYLKKYYVDNAFWADLGSFQIITILPHSLEWEDSNKLRFWETPGVFSHEYGHHIFHTYGPSVEYPSKRLMYHQQFSRINNGFNEGFADLISYYSLSFRQQLNPALLLSGQTHGHQNRDVNTPSLKYETSSFQLSISKKYDSLVAEILGSTFTYELNSSDYEGYLIQECHESGAIMAYVFNKLLDGYGYRHMPHKKMELIIAWLHKQEASMRITGNLTSPHTHLDSALNGMFELLDGIQIQSGLQHLSIKEKDDLIFELFPHYYSSWAKKVEQ